MGQSGVHASATLQMPEEKSDMDDLPPTGDEARRRRLDTVMPLVWGLLGVVVMLVFVIGLASHWTVR